MRIDSSDFDSFLRINAELKARATRYFEERAKHFENQLRHEIVSIDFSADGGSITYTSHCCHREDETNDICFSFDDLAAFEQQ